MKRAAKTDQNQGDVVDALRKYGAYVRYLSQGDGLPDLLVGYNGETILMEVKDGSKPPSQTRLTDRELKFFEEWKGGKLYIVYSVQEALDILDLTRG